MNLSDIHTHLGITKAALAELIGFSPQNLAKYLTGEKPGGSKVIRRILDVSGLSSETVYFGDSFSHPDGENRDHPAYWVNLAIEALDEAKKRGLPRSAADHACKMITDAIQPLLSEDEGAPEIF